MDKRICSVEGCEGAHKGHGYCGKHYQRFKRYGTVEDRVRATRECAGPGCSIRVEVAQGLGMCKSHYKQHSLGKPLTPLRVATKDLGRPKVCTFPDCDRPHKARGLCKGHNDQVKSAKPLAPLQARRGPGICSAEECSRPRFANDLCTRHNASRFTRWRSYGLTPKDGATIYESQGGACAICRSAKLIDDLHIDHDHGCCPTSRNGCGACVRGLLCQPCNIGLGYMRDDPQRLLAAANYLISRAPGPRDRLNVDRI